MGVEDMGESDHTFLVGLWQAEDVFHHGVEEMSVRGIGPYLEHFADVLQ